MRKCLAVYIQHTHVTDIQMYRQTTAQAALCIATCGKNQQLDTYTDAKTPFNQMNSIQQNMLYSVDLLLDVRFRKHSVSI